MFTTGFISKETFQILHSSLRSRLRVQQPLEELARHVRQMQGRECLKIECREMVQTPTRLWVDQMLALGTLHGKWHSAGRVAIV